jgi:hypothetical protein
MTVPDSILFRLRHVKLAKSCMGLQPLISEAADEIEEHDQSFDLRWKADMRAIKRWQAEKPGLELTWPDHADLCVWLLEQNDRLRTALERIAGGRWDEGTWLHRDDMLRVSQEALTPSTTTEPPCTCPGWKPDPNCKRCCPSAGQKP